MPRRTTVALCLTLLLAAGCATGPQAPPVGASVQPLEAGRFRVSFRGRSRTPPPEVSDRALLQAARTAVAQGDDWFQVVSRSEAPAPPTSPQFSLGLGLGGASFGRGSGVGGGVGGSETFGGGETLVVTLEVIGGHGPRPPTPDAYDAQGVASTLGARYP